MAAIDMLDSFLDKEPLPLPDKPLWTFEGFLGAAIMRGEIDATEAYRALDAYEAWVEQGEPKCHLSN